MQTTLEFIDALKARHGLDSDYAIAKLLDITRASLSSYRTGKTHFSDDVAIRVAELLELDAGYVMACIASERARSPQVKAQWKHTAEMLYGIAATVTIAIGVGLIVGGHNDTLPMLAGFIEPATGGTLYIM